MKKRFIIIGLITLLLCMVLFVSAQIINEPVMKGDVNGDGTINIVDAILVVNSILYPESPASEEEFCAADCNGDSNVDILDVLLIVNVILNPDDFRFVSSCDELDCDDNNTCTQDYCDSLCIQCKHTALPSGTLCDDGDACTENDECVEGNCQGTLIICDDGDPCTDDFCDPLTGECEYEPKSCDDGNPYTDDSCNPLTGECENVFPNCGTVTDIDGNVYQTVIIGNQCWMVENLKVTRYRNGDPIPNVTDNTEWTNLTTGARCDYDNNADNVPVYGRLYNWYAVNDSRGIAPEGWHVPTDGEWKQLEMYLGMSQSEVDDTGFRGTDEGGKMKESGYWFSPNTGATNESGFTALPGGYRYHGNGDFDLLIVYAFFWSSTEHSSYSAWSRTLSYSSEQVGRHDYSKLDGFSVRCVRD